MESQFKLPTETVELPSKGLLYPEDSPLSSGKIEMKYMTAKEEDILTYRNKSFSSPVTGTVAPIHHTPWAEAMDDSMDTFMKSK